MRVLMRLRAVPADIGQGVTLSLLQGQAIGIKQMTSLAADAEGQPLANPDMAVAATSAVRVVSPSSCR